MSRFPAPSARDMFANATTPVELAECDAAFQSSLTKALRSGHVPGTAGRAELAKQIDEQREFLLTKSLTSAQIDSVRDGLATANLTKEWSTTSPLSSGLVSYDLAQTALLLAPRPTPLRNRVAREVGQGLNYQFKRVLGFSGTGTGGSAGAPMRHGINESTVNSFGPGNIQWARGPQIQYATDEKFVPYIETGLSDNVSWAAQFAGQTFEDIRQLSSQILLYSTMLADERMILGGRGTKSGFAGALAAPTGVTLTKRAAAANEVGAGGSIANVYVYVSSISVFGESVPSTVATVATVATGNVVDVTFTDAPGALGYKVYLGTTTGPTNTWAAAVANSSASIDAAPLAAGSSVPGGPITISFTGAGTNGVPNAGGQPLSSDSTAVADEYDGILSYVTGSDSGYVHRLNGTLAGADNGNVGNVFELAFASLWDSVKADPDELLFSGRDRKQLSDQLKNQSSSSYRITVDSGSEVHNAKLGAMATGLQNEITGKMVDLTVHPWLPQGNVPIISWTLPLPDSNVGNCWSVRGPQDMTLNQWPVQQFLYEASTYQFNSLISRAPAWSGCIQGIFQA